MPTAALRKLGGSIVIAIPKRIVELVHLKIGSKVNIDVQEGKLIVEPQKSPYYTLSELMGSCNLKKTLSKEEKSWLNEGTTGLEEI